jgi:two-component system, OmpR family, phosphate regulon response regulator PhoB
MPETVLLVEDEIDLVNTLEFNLKRAGYQVLIASTAQQALQLAAQQPDAVLLDIMLPDMLGTEVCRLLRANAATASIPIIMLTAKGEEADRVTGFEAGADDYVVKPFSVKELLLRVRSVLRRKAPAQFGDLHIDYAARRVEVAGEECVLTVIEFKLLTLLLARKGIVQSREDLLRDVWDIAAHVTTRTVDTHVKRLRQKLGDKAPYIQTQRGVGYLFVDKVS